MVSAGPAGPPPGPGDQARRRSTQRGRGHGESRGGWYYLIDGQHRIAALKLWMPSWENQRVCWAPGDRPPRASGSSPAPCRSGVRPVRSGHGRGVRRRRRPRSSRWARPGGIRRRHATVYTRGGPAVLRALRIIRGYGEPGWRAVIDGIGLVASQRDLSEQRHPAAGRACRLSAGPGSCASHRLPPAWPPPCHSRGSGGRKLPGWWRRPVTPIARNRAHAAAKRILRR
jgi:hypothetical protein